MTRTLAILGMSAFVVPHVAFAQALTCPDDVAPMCKTKSSKCGCNSGGSGIGGGSPGASNQGGSSFLLGDPIATAGQNTWYQALDVESDLPSGTVWATRSYSSSPKTWAAANDLNMMYKVPQAYGRTSAVYESQASSEAWHLNLQAFVYSNGSVTYVRTPWANMDEFLPCSPAPCWATPKYDAQATRLWYLGPWYEYYDEDGTKFLFGSKFVPAGLPSVSLFFLSQTVEPTHVGGYLVSYLKPFPECATSEPGSGSDPNAPYIFEAKSGGQGLRFGWALVRVPGSSTEFECVVRTISLISPGIGGAPVVTPVVTYGYATETDGYEHSGRIASVTGGIQPETFTYTSNTFTRYVEGLPVSSHVHDGTNDVTSSTYEIPSFASVYNFADTYTCTGPCCNSYTQSVITRGFYAQDATLGDGSSGNAGYYQRYMYTNWIGYHGQMPYQKTDACSAYTWCNAGTEGFYPLPSVNAYPAPNSCKEAAVHDKRNTFVFDENLWVVPDAGAYPHRTWERRRAYRGATSGMSLPLAQVAYTHDYDHNTAVQRPTGSSVASLLGTPPAVTGVKVKYANNWSKKPQAVYRHGYTKDIAGNVQQKTYAVFMSTSRVCENIGPDDRSRIVSLVGPCEVVDSNATGCLNLSPGAPAPITEFLYYPVAGTENANAGRLWKVIRYPGGFNGTTCSLVNKLVTEYQGYTSAGDPTVVVDPNTSIQYDFDGSRRMKSRQIGGGAGPKWIYTYDGDDLASVELPEHNFMVMCYRDGAGPGCTGNRVRDLQWVAKSSTGTGATWSEKAVLAYWPDRSLQRIEFYNNNVGTPELRYEHSFQTNAVQQPTWERVGDAVGGFVAKRAFDPSDNLWGIGAAYNVVPDFCGLPTKSMLCAWLEHDRLNRAAYFDQFPNGTSPGVRTSFDYDRMGNVRRVSSGCSTSDTTTIDQPGGTATSQCTTGTFDEYVWDDFHNLLEFQGANTGQVGGNVGTVVYRYNAMGNVVYKTSPQMSYDGRWLEYTYDAVGRLRATIDKSAGQSIPLVNLDYDDPGAFDPTCGTVANVKGHLARMSDPSGVTIYSYTPEGYLAKELRLTPGGTCSASDPHVAANPDTARHTLYAYSPNGNMTTITYPHGRRVFYEYGVAQLRDRVTSVSIDEWTGSGWAASSTTLLSDVRWEPFGAVRGYVMKFASSATSPLGTNLALMENMLGERSSLTPNQLGSANCPGAFNEATYPYDRAGRLRSLRVTNGSTSFASGVPAFGNSSQQIGDIYARTYTWAGDQVAQIDTCLKGSATPQREQSPSPTGYDKTLRLNQVANPNFATAGGYQSGSSFNYDSRGNRNTWIVDAAGSQVWYGYNASARWRDQLLSDRPWGDVNNGHNWAHDRDGRVTRKTWPVAMSKGIAGDELQLSYSPIGAGTVISTVQKFLAGGYGLFSWTYVYDAFSRRTAKIWPVNGIRDEFFYAGHQMLELWIQPIPRVPIQLTSMFGSVAAPLPL